MTYYQLPLFPDGSPLSPEQVRDRVDPAIPRITSVFVDVFDDVQQRRSIDPFFQRMNEGQTAWWIWTQIIHESEQRFDDASLQFCRRSNQSFLIVGEELIVVFKKLRRVKRPRGAGRLERSNYRTAQNMDLWAQRQVAGIPDLPRAVFAYELEKELTAMRLYIGVPSPNSPALTWCQEVDPHEIPVIAEGAYPGGSIPLLDEIRRDVEVIEFEPIEDSDIAFEFVFDDDQAAGS